MIEIKAWANTPVDNHDKITGVPQEPDLPTNIEWDEPEVEVQAKSEQFESPTIKSELAPYEQEPTMYNEPDMVPEGPVKIINDTPTPDLGGGDELLQLC